MVWETVERMASTLFWREGGGAVSQLPVDAEKEGEEVRCLRSVREKVAFSTHLCVHSMPKPFPEGSLRLYQGPSS